MASMLDLLRSAMTPKAPSQAGNNNAAGDEERRAREEFKNASDNYNNVARNTNDKAKQKAAYDRLDAATRAMGQYH